MNETNLNPASDDSLQPAAAKPRWETPRIEVLPISMTENSTSGPSDGTFSSLSS